LLGLFPKGDTRPPHGGFPREVKSHIKLISVLL
jgi:hypothetical protein